VLRRFPAPRPSPCDAFRRSPEGRARTGASRLRARSRRTSVSACRFARPKTRGAGTGRLGAARCETRPGRIALHGAVLTSATDRSSREGVFFRRARPRDRLWHPCRLLRAGAWIRFSSNARRRLGGRQDRFRGGLVKGVRFADPGCLPPAVATRIPPAPKRKRNRAASIEDAALT